MKACEIEDCERPAIARGWCQGHYDHWRRTGDPDGGHAAADQFGVVPPGIGPDDVWHGPGRDHAGHAIPGR